MLGTRASVLTRAITQFARNGKLLGVAAKNSNQLQLQSIRFSGDWTYRTGHISHPLWKRATAQFFGGCKFLDLTTANAQRISSNGNFVFHSPFFSSYVVVDYLAFVLGLGTYCR